MAQIQSKIKTLGKYQLKEEIGQGGMATVFKARDLSLDRDVAVKVLHPHLISNTEARTRFKREARAVARLKNRSIVEVYDYSEDTEGEVFLVMELIEGITLRNFLDDQNGQPLLSEAAALISRKVFLALQTAHDEGIVHRDVKPENILIDNNGNIKLSDFGIAYLAGIGQMTTTGQILGSPAYMSPEQIESSVVDARADIFSMGTILYEMTTGNLPFTGNTPHQIIKRVVEGYYDNPLSVNPSVGDGIASITVKCLQVKQELRFDTAADVALALEKHLLKLQISNFDTEQHKLFKDIKKWQKKIYPQIIEKTLLQAGEARAKHHLPEAMNHLNRVLAMDPGNASALETVNVLSKKRRFKRNIERISTFLVITAIISALIWVIIDSPWAGSNKEPVIKSTGIKKLIIPSDKKINTDKIVISQIDSNKRIVIVDKNSSAPVKKVKIIRRRHPRHIAKNKTRQVIFVPHPMNVQVNIDDKEKFTYKISDRTRMLSIGSHSITFIPADNRMESLKQQVIISEGSTPYTLKVRLNWRPGILKIKSNVQAMVSINGREVGKTNSPISLKIKKGPYQNINILISAKGYMPVQKNVKITAGQITFNSINLQKKSKL